MAMTKKYLMILLALTVLIVIAYYSLLYGKGSNQSVLQSNATTSVADMTEKSDVVLKSQTNTNQDNKQTISTKENNTITLEIVRNSNIANTLDARILNTPYNISKIPAKIDEIIAVNKGNCLLYTNAIYLVNYNKEKASDTYDCKSAQKIETFSLVGKASSQYSLNSRVYSRIPTNNGEIIVDTTACTELSKENRKFAYIVSQESNEKICYATYKIYQEGGQL